MNRLHDLLPFGLVAVCVGSLVYTAIPPGDPGEMLLAKAAALPVLDGGRLKPLDTLARTSLTIISSRGAFRDADGRNDLPPVKWLLDVMSKSGTAYKQEIVRIDNEQLLAFFKLKPRPNWMRYSLDELKGRWADFKAEANRAHKLAPKQRTLFDAKVVELAEHLELFSRLAGLRQPLILPGKPGEEVRSFAGVDEEAVVDVLIPEIEKNGMEAAKQLAALPEEAKRQTIQMFLDRMNPAEREEMLRPLRSRIDARVAELNPAAAGFQTMLDAYARNDAAGFNTALDAFAAKAERPSSWERAQIAFEVFFNHFQPFYQCMTLYGLVIVLCCLAWLGWGESLNRAAFLVAVLTIGLHTFALLSRMGLQWRPPVTNLYSSGVFIGWGAVLLGLYLERVFRNGLGTLVAALLGFLTVYVSHFYLAGEGDTLEMMQAVLDTNFWLATHVTCVTLGYTATFVAGFLAAVYVVIGVLTPNLDRKLARDLSQMIYGVVCFATLLSFTGTVLGGIWADQSWGRFWGWDPKENGALLIVIWNALVLHARWGGMAKPRGIAVLAIVGNMVTAWSWFGTNQLSVGLHSYGFSNALAIGLKWFWLSQLALIGLGMTPLRWWMSFRNEAMDKPNPGSGSGRHHAKPKLQEV